MLLLARRLPRAPRGVTDAVLPLAILNIGQIESLMIGFAMNLILTSSIAIALILAVAPNRRRWMGSVCWRSASGPLAGPPAFERRQRAGPWCPRWPCGWPGT